MSNLSASDLLPEEHIHRLLQVRGAGDAEFWTIGDVASELEGECAGNRAKKIAVRNAISDFAGVTPQTVGEYKSHAEFYPPHARAVYPTLTRWHFRKAKRAGQLYDAQKWLDFARDSSDDYGGDPMPVRVLGAKMDAALGKPVSPYTHGLEVWRTRARALACQCRKLRLATSPAQRTAAAEAVAAAQRAVGL